MFGTERSEQRGFIHSRIKRGIVGGIKGIIKSGPLGALPGAARGFFGGGGGTTVSVVPGRCPPGFLATAGGGCAPIGAVPLVSGVPALPPSVPGATGRAGCPPGTVWDPQGQFCVSPKSPVGKRALGDQFGEAVMGRYGAALIPDIQSRTVSDCPRGTVLGDDDLCYNKRDLRNSERKWPVGRKPLLTGGEVRAIGIASAAAKRLTAKTKMLESMGMLPKTKRA